jgi:hypothetical protein
MRSAQGLRLSDQPQSEVGPPGPVKAADISAEGRVEIAAERSRQDAPVGWPKSNASRRSSELESDRPESKSSGIGKRLLRTSIFRFALAALIGVAGTLSWQAYGDRAQDRVRAWAPSLDRLIPPSTTKSATANAGPAELAEQLKPIALDLVVVRKAVEQLAANQQQLAAKDGEIMQSIAALQATERELEDKISSLPATKVAHVPPRRPPQHPPLSLNAQ